MLAEFVQYKIRQQLLEIERLDSDALLPNLAERPAD